MWLKDILLVALVAGLVDCQTTTTTTTTTTADPDTLDYTTSEYGNFEELFNTADTSGRQRLGPPKTSGGADQKCTDDAGCSSHTGTKCYGITDCKYCVCDPYTYNLYKRMLVTWTSNNNVWQWRAYYSTTLSKCLNARKIGESCEENDQCPDNGAGTGTRSCTSGSCTCTTYYRANTNSDGCIKNEWGQSCNVDTDCNDAATSGEGFVCTSSLCACQTSQYYHTKSSPSAGQSVTQACRRSYWGQDCVNDADCDSTVLTGTSHKYLSCQTVSGVTTKQCRCDPTKFDTVASPTTNTVGSTNCFKVLVGSTGCNTGSSQSSVCYGGGSSTMCDGNTCKCLNTHPIVAGDSKSCTKITVGSTYCSVTPSATNVQAYGGSPTQAQHNARCYDGATSTECDTSVTNGKCVCMELKPRVASNSQSCTQLYVGETYCSVRNTGANVKAYTSSSHDSRCITSNTKCDTTVTNGRCVCLKTRPIPETGDMSCRLVKVNEAGCDSRPSAYSTKTETYATGSSTAIINARCYSGGSTSTCDTSSNTCMCDGNNPQPATNLLSCGKSGYNQPCNADSDCLTSVSGAAYINPNGLKCSTSGASTNTGTCICDNAKFWYTDGSPATGVRDDIACRRINLGTAGCDGQNSRCEGNFITRTTKNAYNSDRAVCSGSGSSAICQCKSGYKQYGTNYCDQEYEYNGVCLTTATNNVQCYTGNLTCTSNKCVCSVASNEYISAKSRCQHTEAKYDVAVGETCTSTYPTSADWTRKIHTTAGSGASATNALWECKSGVACAACNRAAGSTEIKKCKEYRIPVFPNSVSGLKTSLAVLITLVLAAFALV